MKFLRRLGVITFFPPIFPAKQEEHQIPSAAFPEKARFLIERCSAPIIESKGLFGKTRDRNRLPGIIWTNPGWAYLFLIFCTNFFLLSGENEGEKCYDPESDLSESSTIDERKVIGE